MENSKIEWCDHTFNPWEGCTKVSDGCTHCYAEARNARFGGGDAPNWGKGAPRRRTKTWGDPVRWDRKAEEDMTEWYAHMTLHGGNAKYPKPESPRVFSASLADWLDDEVPIEWLADFLELIDKCRNLDFLLLTKRPENFFKRMQQIRDEARASHGGAVLAMDWRNGHAPANVWIGTTVENQAMADKRIPELLKIPARVRFLSCEPLLGPVDLRGPGLYVENSIAPAALAGYEPRIHWVIAGGESGKDARPMHPKWVEAIRDQCQAAHVPFLFKQWGEWHPCLNGVIDAESKKDAWVDMRGNVIPDTVPLSMQSTATEIELVGKKAAGRLLDGREWNEFPKMEVSNA
jgi:protein gp37